MPATIFITGSSTSLGRATALPFTSRRWKVTATLPDLVKESERTVVPGSDARESGAQRLAVGIENIRKAIAQRFMG